MPGGNSKLEIDESTNTIFKSCWCEFNRNNHKNNKSM